MKRGWLAVLGVLVLVVGIALAAAGAFVATTVGSDDAISTAPARVRGTGVAVVAEDVRVEEGGLPFPAGVGSLTLSVRARDGREMFAGVAAPKDIDRYLTGVPYDVVIDLSAGSLATTRAVPGTQQPPPPDSERFWTASSRGAPASLPARFAPGATLVVMNADATPGVDADVVATLRVPNAWVYAWVAVGIGVLLGILGIVLIWRARTSRRTAPAPAGDQVGATVLPGAVLGVAAEPSDEDLVAPTPDAPVPLVVEAAVSGADQRWAPVDVVDVADAEPVESDPADPDAVAEEWYRSGTSAVAAPAGAESDAGADKTPDDESDAGADPVFAELVSAYGVDPVHDALPADRGVGRDGAGADLAASPPSGPTPSDD